MRSYPTRPIHILGLGLLATLLACGGGSSSPSSPLAPQGPPVPSITKATTVAGINGQSGTLEGALDYAQLKLPNGLALDSKGNLFVADETAHVIRRITPQGLNTIFAGGANASGHEDGLGADARFHGPVGLAIDTADNLYVAEYQSCTIRKITPTGQVSTLAGQLAAGFADGQGSSASFDHPVGLAIDTTGNLYVADANNKRIRKVTPGGLVSTVAGTGVAGFTDGPVAAATLDRPYGVAVAPDGTIYFTEMWGHLVRRVTQGQVQTVAGTAGSQGARDGRGAAARFHSPLGLSVDAAGAVYVADGANDTLRKVLPDGTTTTVAGQAGTSGYGTGPVASVRLNGPLGCLVSGRGVYVSFQGSYVIQRFD